ncbi:MAG: glycosyl hydrolase 115 family protein [Polyangiaceae bacterium]|nr:glycosyl hydrolase 115 family protein [Polyangiaceae bacterium]
MHGAPTDLRPAPAIATATPLVAANAAPTSSWSKASPEQAAQLAALDRGAYIAFTGGPGDFPLVADGRAAPIFVSDTDFPGVLRATRNLPEDVAAVTHIVPAFSASGPTGVGEVVVVGTLGRAPFLDSLVATKKLDVSSIVGRWETHLITVVDGPSAGIKRALVIAGSDQRGTIYGVYDLCRQIGVSPWHFWDDVPAARHEELFVKPGRYSQGEPRVKYRGFFVNDENPALDRWARARFGPAPNAKHPHGFNHQLYAEIYEVLLRLRGNYLWPATWGRSLFDDDPENQPLAAEYGIVMGTSHEAPMMRGQDEWNRYGPPTGPYGGTGDFSFVRNQAAIEQYWADGLRRMNGYESLITVGMRGNGDTGMEDAAGTELMGRIVTKQRELIRQTLGKDPTDVPQVWTLYKEVQDYWTAGMRAPDDVTIIWCDDNWGNLRGLPDQRDPMRGGGYGIYYHFDYVGGGRNYKWVDTTLLPNLWEQLHLTHSYGVDRVWMTNVGDLKNEEHPLEFFLDYAWDPARWPLERLSDWEAQWAAKTFGTSPAKAIAAVLREYGRLQSRRKPELLNRRISLDPRFDLTRQSELDRAVVYTDDSPFSLTDYREAERVVSEWRALARAAEAIRPQLPSRYADAFYELVYYQVVATANVYELRLAQFQNRLYARQGRAGANARADLAEARFEQDRAMSAYYDTELAGGKWAHWQTQPKLGYGGPYPDSDWQQPQRNNDAIEDFIWPELVRVRVPPRAELAVAIDGSEELWLPGSATAPLPEFSPFQTQPAQFVEIVNRGQQPFSYQVKPGVPWLSASSTSGTVQAQTRVELSVVDWARVPRGRTEVPVVVQGPGAARITVRAIVTNPEVDRLGLAGFVEANGVVSMEAEHYARSIAKGDVFWKLIPDIGRTAGGLTPFPVTAPRQTPGSDGPRLEYDINTFTTGPVTVWAFLSPRNNVIPSDGLKYAVSLDDEPPQIVNSTAALNAIPMNRSWERNTSDNIARLSTTHRLDQPGRHVLRFWMVDPTLIVQKLVVDLGGLRPSYLGPPESFRVSTGAPGR